MGEAKRRRGRIAPDLTAATIHREGAGVVEVRLYEAERMLEAMLSGDAAQMRDIPAVAKALVRSLTTGGTAEAPLCFCCGKEIGRPLAVVIVKAHCVAPDDLHCRCRLRAMPRTE